MEPHLGHLLEDAGLKPEDVDLNDVLDRESEQYHLFCRDMLRSSIRVIEANMGRLTGNSKGHDLKSVLADLDLDDPEVPSTPAPVAAPEPAAAPLSPPTPMAERPVTESLSNAPGLQSLLAEFERRKTESGKWRESTVRNHRPKMNAMLQVFGQDRPVDQITVQDVREFAKILELLPPGFALKGYEDLHGVTSSELESKRRSGALGPQALDVTTRREYLNFTKSVFEFALENEYIGKNPVISGNPPRYWESVRCARLDIIVQL